MSKPVSEWDEAYILSLPKESNEFERKGSKLLDLTIEGVKEDRVLDELAKQLSAFANTGGGGIIYGLKDDGTVDSGGVSAQIKSGGTKEWLERQIVVLTDYEILGVGVYEFPPKSPGSQIQDGKALYVIDVPDSDRAPHQSKRDLRYYVRLGTQSLPAPHRLIEDIRNRQKHPRVSLREVKIERVSAKQTGQELGLHSVAVELRVVLVNNGPLKSTDTFLLLKPEQGGFDFVRSQILIVTSVEGPLTGGFQLCLNRPLPPQSEISFRTDYWFQAKLSLDWKWRDSAGRTLLEDVAIAWTVFADSAPPQTGRFTLGSLDLIPRLNERLR